MGSLTLAAILSLGVVFLTFETDAAYLFTPDVSRARDELAYMEEHYLPDYDNFWMSRSLTTEEKMGNLIVIPKDGENVLTDEIIDEVLQIDVELKEMKVQINETYIVNFTQVCGQLNGECLSNPLLEVLSLRKQMGGNLILTYPKTILPNGMPVMIGNALGGVVLGENNTILGARALTFGYLLKSGDTSTNIPSLLWEEAFSHYVIAYESRNLEASFLTSQSLSEELLAMTHSVMPLFCITFGVLFTFAVGCCLMSDWVQSKPWLGQLGKNLVCIY